MDKKKDFAQIQFVVEINLSNLYKKVQGMGVNTEFGFKPFDK